MRARKVTVNGDDLVSLKMNKLTTEYQSNDFYTYTVKDDKLMRTFLRGHGFIGTSTENEGAIFRIGDHPIMDNIKSFDITKKPVTFSYSPRMQCLLFGPGELYSL